MSNVTGSVEDIEINVEGLALILVSLHVIPLPRSPFTLFSTSFLFIDSSIISNRIVFYSAQHIFDQLNRKYRTSFIKQIFQHYLLKLYNFTIQNITIYDTWMYLIGVLALLLLLLFLMLYHSYIIRYALNMYQLIWYILREPI